MISEKLCENVSSLRIFEHCDKNLTGDFRAKLVATVRVLLESGWDCSKVDVYEYNLAHQITRMRTPAVTRAIADTGLVSDADWAKMLRAVSRLNPDLMSGPKRMAYRDGWIAKPESRIDADATTDVADIRLGLK